MKTTTRFLTAAACAFALTADVRSQAFQRPATPLQQLQVMKEGNAKLIEAQTATLKKLEEMKVQAQQTKAFTQRS